MSAKEIGNKLVGLCREGKNMDAINELYADQVVSVEAAAPPTGGSAVTEGKPGVIGKSQWWVDNHDVHSSEVKGPFPHGDDKFAVIFNFDVTFKPMNQRQQMEEVGIYTVADGKIVREEFFYSMG